MLLASYLLRQRLFNFNNSTLLRQYDKSSCLSSSKYYYNRRYSSTYSNSSDSNNIHVSKSDSVSNSSKYTPISGFSNIFSANMEAKIPNHKPKEITFNTPIGIIAGQEWGNPNGENKVICIHGWLDNCASFQPLIPYILDYKNNADTYHIIAFDQSGVGLSCHRPVGTEYHQLGQVIEIKRIVSELNWSSFHIIGHSMGSHFSFLYSCIFPDEVRSFISIDLAYPITRTTKDWASSMAIAIKEQLLFEKYGDNDPTTNFKVGIYSKEEALKRLVEAHGTSLTKETAEVLLARGASKQRWGYVFNRDVRLRKRNIEMWPDEEAMLKYMQGSFTPNFLLILGLDSFYAKVIDESKFEVVKQLFADQCKSFKLVSLKGTHHLHMNNPDTVSVPIIEFLENQKIADSKL